MHIFSAVFIAAIITPPDVMSQMLVTIPMYLLYEATVFVSAMVLRNAQKQALQEATEVDNTSQKSNLIDKP